MRRVRYTRSHTRQAEAQPLNRPRASHRPLQIYPLVPELAVDGIPVTVTCRVLKIARHDLCSRFDDFMQDHGFTRRESEYEVRINFDPVYVTVMAASQEDAQDAVDEACGQLDGEVDVDVITIVAVPRGRPPASVYYCDGEPPRQA